MSTTSRGNQAQDLARKELEAEGWLVETAVPQNRVRWSRAKNDYEQRPQHDFFRVADLIAVKADRVRFVQVTHPGGVSARLAKMQALVPAKLLDAPLLSWEVWEKRPVGFVIRLAKPGGAQA